MRSIQPMERVRVLLAVTPRLLGESLAGVLRQCPSIDVVATVDDPIELLVAVAESRANVVIQSWSGVDEMPEVCTHLFAEYPEVEVIGIPPDGSCVCVCRQTIEITRSEDGSLSGVVAAVCRKSRTDRPNEGGNKRHAGEEPDADGTFHPRPGQVRVSRMLVQKGNIPNEFC